MHQDLVTCMSAAPNGELVVTGSFGSDKEVNARTANGELVTVVTANNSHCYMVVFSPDGSSLFYHTREKMSLYRVSDWERLWFVDFPGSISSVNYPERNAAVGFTPGGQLYLVDRQGPVTLIDPNSQAAAETLQLGPLVSLSYAPDGNTIVVVRSRRVLELLPRNP